MYSRKIISIVVLLITLFMMGCASTPNRLKEEITAVPISRDANLNITHLWPLAMQGSYLQKIQTTIKNRQGTQTHAFSVYLTVDQQKLDAIAFNDISGRLYQLTWIPDYLVWTRSTYIPATLKPENIIADFLATHLSIAQLNANLSGATAQEHIDQTIKVRVLKNNTGVLRKIIYSKPEGHLWKNVIISNPQLGYSLVIQTVRQ